MSETTEFSRAGGRAATQKPFNTPYDAMAGATNKELLKKANPAYEEARKVYDNCMMYAYSYTQTMLNRVLEEEPDFFEDKEISRPEFVAHLQNNLCLGASKYHSFVMKDTQAKLTENYFLNDKIRRLTNGGDKFHPYL